MLMRKFGTTLLPANYSLTLSQTSAELTINYLNSFDLRGIAFNPSLNRMYVCGGGSPRRICQFQLGSGMNSNKMIASKYTSFGIEDTAGQDAQFSSDGTKLYLAGYTTKSIYQYSLSTAWDIGSKTLVNTLVLGNGLLYASCITFKPNGLSFYVCEYSNATIHQYNLSTAWDISTAVFYGVNTSISGGKNKVQFSTDGLVIYFPQGAIIKSYNLSTAWDITTITTLISSLSTSITLAYGFNFSTDGTYFYVGDLNSTKIIKYNLSTAWLLSTSVIDTSFLVYAEIPLLQNRNINFATDGLSFTAQNLNDNLQFPLETAYDLSVVYSPNKRFNPTGTGGVSSIFSVDGSKLFTIDNATKSIYRYRKLFQNVEKLITLALKIPANVPKQFHKHIPA